MQTKKRAKSVKFGKQEKKTSDKEVQSEKATVKKEEQQKKTESIATDVLHIEEPQQVQSNAQLNQQTPHLEPVQPGSAQNEQQGFIATNNQLSSPPNPQVTPTPEMVAPLSVSPQPTQPNQQEIPSQFQTVAPLIQTAAETTEKNDEQDFPESEKKKGMLRYFLLVMIVTFLIGLAFIGGVYYATKNKNFSLSHLSLGLLQKVSPTVTPIKTLPTAVPQQSASKSADLTAYTIEILNGSGISGEAAKVKDQLTSAGFKIGNIGNADRNDYMKTQLFAKKTVNSAYLDALKAVLNKAYVVETESSLPSAISSDADVIITIGSLKAQ